MIFLLEAKCIIQALLLWHPEEGGKKNPEHLPFAWGKYVAVPFPALMETSVQCESGNEVRCHGCPLSPQDVFTITSNAGNLLCRRDLVFLGGLCCFPQLPVGNYMWSSLFCLFVFPLETSEWWSVPWHCIFCALTCSILTSPGAFNFAFWLYIRKSEFCVICTTVACPENFLGIC